MTLARSEIWIITPIQAGRIQRRGMLRVNVKKSAGIERLRSGTAPSVAGRQTTLTKRMLRLNWNSMSGNCLQKNPAN